MIYVLADAVADANAAIKLNPSYALAYLRKGVACHHLEEYETALAAFKAGAKLEPSNAKFRNGIRKAEAELQSQGGLVCEGSEGACNEDDCKAEDYGAKLEPSNAKFRNGIRNGIRKAELQSQEEDMTVDAPAPSAPSTSEAPASAPTASAAPTSSAPVTTPAPAPAPAPPKYRHEFYQSATTVVVTVFAKGVSSEQLKVQIGEQVLSVVIESTNDEPPYVLQLRLFGKVYPVEVGPAKSKHVLMSTKVEVRLAKAESTTFSPFLRCPLTIFASSLLPPFPSPPQVDPAKSKHVRMSTKVEVDPAKSKHVLMSTKIEVRLAKAEAIHWTALEATRRPAVVQPVNVSDETAEKLKHMYPSSRKQHVNWDQLEAEVKAEEKDEKLEGDAALNKLFQDIYAGADEETRRAMNKSFVESKAEPYLVTKAKQLRGIADAAQADLDAANDLLQQRLAEEAPLAQKAAAADAEVTAATTELNSKRAELEAAKVEQETARQALIQAKQVSRDERSYLDDLESQAEEAIFEESEAAKDVLDAIARQNTTAVVLNEQQKIATEAYNDAVAAARSAARLQTPEAKALQTELYNVKLQADRILGAVKKQADRAVQRVSERETESEKVKKDKSETRGAADVQKAVKEKAEKDEADSNVFFTKAVGKTKNLDTAVKTAGQNYNAKVKAQRDAKLALAPKVNARAAQERVVAMRKSRADASKGNADNADREARGRGLKF
ncbi:unnamed protein product [Closterium sp. NIES-64]|nr:unnamed protein product [Closterium sp. NIES-64]